jgi:hypothetical protein
VGDNPKPGIYFGDASERPELPEQNNYETAEAMARQALLHLDPHEQAERCGARVQPVDSGQWTVDSDSRLRHPVSSIQHPSSDLQPPASSLQPQCEILFDWFSRPVAVSFPDGAVRNVRDGVEVPIWERIILLHYIGSIAPVSPGAELIGFNEVPSGSFYLDAFVRRSHKPLAGFFGSNPRLLHDAGELLGAAPAGLGDASVSVPVVPKVAVTAVVHAADDEFPADAKLLFPASIVSFFCTEDIAVIGGFAAGRLIRAGRQVQGISK